MHLRPAALLFSCLIALAIATVTRAAEVPFAEVRIANGLLAGTPPVAGVWSFLGVPYAQPPVGSLRWREPRASADWTGVRRADRFGPRPMQPTLWRDMVFRSEQMAEDCLYLNVGSAAASPASRLPVLVYFHGGGLVAGDGSEPRYDGASMARRGIVVVTVNYRLGIFGFLAHPELTKESPHRASGNYGFLDQNAALRWVQRNIAAFGGDPHRVTIGGQSAGAASVCVQMASPLSRDLFVGAIGQSGSALGSRDRSLAEAEQAGLKFAAETGVASLADLRQMSAERLLAASSPLQFSRGVVVDGYFLPETPPEIFFTGRQADVPLLAGWNSAEAGCQALLGAEPPTVANLQHAVQRLYGENAAVVLKLYPAANPTEAMVAATALASDRFSAYRTWKWLDVHSKSSGQPVFRYLFTQLPPPEYQPAGEKSVSATPPGPPHSAEIPYALGNLPLIGGRTWTDADVKTSATLQKYFENFVKAGDPNGPGLPRWPWIQASIPEVMMIRAESAGEPESNLERYLLLDTL